MKQKKPLSHQSNLRIFAANASENPLKELETVETDRFQLKPASDNEDASTVKITSIHSKCIDAKTMDWIKKVMEDNMKEYYEKSANGWNLKQKEKEFRHETARFLMCTVSSDKGDQPIGFVHYRFELDDEGKHPAIYCYEIQICKDWQSRGLGKYLMTVLHDIGARFKMYKVMLTCFKHNESTLSFYAKLGYTPDIMSPSRSGQDVDYEILSLKIRNK
jgi:GNAT superfamily N-acetyltransferase